ncbi:MAG: helix-turn-helix domain-containing protein [Natronospirillum sp.]|uniref:GlxA family transcriptional regulator n=1 Tax=Natronospirillum sp. TaxID=2812955 RepID=UPI0025F2A08E|nr:helix-turn-helix domain-containing protein [Natronospirillum sp.]MCH8552710.1 helix-turn-helix domain-containing protein [Natronospirillum sp.]
MRGGAPDEIGLLLAPGFSVGSLGALLDVLRALQEIESPDLRLRVCARPDTTADDWPLPWPTDPLPEQLPDRIQHWFVVGGPSRLPDTQHPLYQLLSQGSRFACWSGIASGSLWLAAAGLLDGHEATLNAPEDEYLPWLSRVRRSARVVCADRDRFTCLSNSAARDLGLAWVTHCYSAALANQLDSYLLAERTPTDNTPFVASRHLPDNLREANSLMHSNIQEPLSADEVATLVGVSRRQLERWYKEYFNSSPARYYLQIRLEQARHMLLHTHLSIAEIAVATGFSSPAHFATCYRKAFGLSPSAARQRPVQ